MNKETKVYGCSDDLIEICGEINAEHGCSGTADKEQGVLVVFSDGTLLEVKYAKDSKDIWGIRVVERGTLFEKLDICTDEDAEIYSDIAYFNQGLKWAYCASEWARAK